MTVSQLLETPASLYCTATQEMIHAADVCRAEGVAIAELLPDGEFGRDAVVTLSQETQTPVLVRAKANMTVRFGGEFLTLDALAESYPPERCHLYAGVG